MYFDISITASKQLMSPYVVKPVGVDSSHHVKTNMTS